MTVNTAVWLVSSPLPEIPFDKVLLPGGGLAELSREVVKTAPIPSGAVSLAFPNFELFFFLQILEVKLALKFLWQRVKLAPNE